MAQVSEALDKFIESTSVRMDSARGLETVVGAIGYRRDFSGLLENFFNDNPGAVEAVIEWIGNQRSQEWIDSLNQEAGE